MKLLEKDFQKGQRFALLNQVYCGLIDRRDKYSECTRNFVSIGRGDKSRFRFIPDVLVGLDPMFPAYQVFEKKVKKITQEKECDPNELIVEAEWAEFKW